VLAFGKGVGELFRTADRFSLALLCGPVLNKIMNVWHMRTQLVSHHGNESVRDLSLLCRNKMLRPIGIMVVSGARSLFLMSVIPVTLGRVRRGSTRLGNKFFTNRLRVATRCLPTPGLENKRTRDTHR